VVYRIFLN